MYQTQAPVRPNGQDSDENPRCLPIFIGVWSCQDSPPILRCFPLFAGFEQSSFISFTGFEKPTSPLPTFVSPLPFLLCFHLTTSLPSLLLPRHFATMPALSFDERLGSGHYDTLASVFIDDPEALAAVDFDPESKPWPSNPKNYSTTLSLIGESCQELIVTLIGEVAKEGTELGPRGNAWIKAGGVILDKTPAKDVLVLKVPTLSPHALKVVFSNQVQTLEAIQEAELPVPLVRIVP